MTKVAVTGGSGFIGGHLVEALVSRGAQVRALVRPTSRTAVLDAAGAELVYGDLADAASVAAAVGDADVVYHCGAIVSDWAAPGMFDVVNAAGTRNVVDATVAAGARLLHVSSTDVYGFPDRGGLGESTPRTRRGWGYVDAKIAGEEAVERAVAEQGLDAVIVRPASVYGPRCPYFVEGCVELMNAGQLSHIGDGAATGGFIYVADLVRLILAAADRAGRGEIFNGTGGRPETWREYFEGLARVTGASPITTNLDKQEAFALAEKYEQEALAAPDAGDPALTRHAWAMYATDQHFSVAKARELLGWEPETTLSEGLAQVGSWWADR
ncbi:NAD-dependent epimerase/dehydratase family protein [Streptomyces sp. NPDC048277]|uniref:NAD-dependent epimerase/dehydratase family protein n=1 Tax=Streptomyces sp. NPDC048277 TaxID=3155027 RepID=UPI0033FD39B1